MNYITTVAAAKKWGITITRISILAKNGRIPGAVQIGSRWMIPENAEKPADGRTKKAKNELRENDFFRYPLFEHRDVSSFQPPLSEDELKLKGVREAYYACDFEEADCILGDLCEKAQNKYIRIFRVLV